MHPEDVSASPSEVTHARERLILCAAMFVALWIMACIVRNLLARSYPGTPGLEAWPMPGTVFAAVGIVMSVAVVLVMRRYRDGLERLITIGLVFEVLTAALVAIPSQWHPISTPTRISWVCLVIVLFPHVVQTTPGRTLVAAVLAASMDPLGAWIAHMRGVSFDTSTLALVAMFLPNYVCAAISVVPSRVIRGLTGQLREARELGGYKLGAVIGSGGMGEVYRGEHRLLARPAAIKVIKPDALGTGRTRRVALERFKREAQAAAVLRSPHTIELYDFGVSSDGTFYYVMELLDGVSLEDLVQRFGPLPASRAVHLMRQACDSLAEAHERGIIHRDIKPSNLVASRLGYNVDFVKILDFGLVKFNGADEERPATLTAPDVATGTPAFMAPEVAIGERNVDPRLDIYSLGCVMYWLLTGQLVFEDGSSLKMMHRHISEAPAPPSQRTELPIPPEIDAIVLSCLAKQASERPTALELGERMCRLDAEWSDDRARRWWDKHIPQRARISSSHPQISTLMPEITGEQT